MLEIAYEEEPDAIIDDEPICEYCNKEGCGGCDPDFAYEMERDRRAENENDKV